MDRQLHLVTDPALDAVEQVRRIEAAIPHGIDTVHVRMPSGVACEVYELAVVLQASLLDRDIPLIVNDRVDVALAVNAKGVQLGVRSLPVRAVRQMLGPEAPIGASVHSVDEARAAEREGATWVSFGHVYETASHLDEPPRGFEVLHDVVDAVRVPVIAIGGITAERVPEVLGAGASGIAVISAILGAEDIAGATRSLREALDAHFDV
ncbi:MAG TPA: thiamine phosphate synthase [Thermomicrobiales bacterium]|nr:thiamine phosphate synthase [Thermomicrobiales bacterium]